MGQMDVPVGGWITNTEPQLEAGYWYELVLLKMTLLELVDLKMGSKNSSQTSCHFLEKINFK